MSMRPELPYTCSLVAREPPMLLCLLSTTLQIADKVAVEAMTTAMMAAAKEKKETLTKCAKRGERKRKRQIH